VIVVALASGALLVSSALIGSTIGAFLHRPVLRNLAWSLILAVAALIGTVLLPPAQSVLRNFNRGQTGGVGLLLVGTVATAACSTAASAGLAGRRRS
jgi:fucose permease